MSKALALNGLLLIIGLLAGGLLMSSARAQAPLYVDCATVTPSLSPSPTRTTIPLNTAAPSPSPTPNDHPIFLTATKLAQNYPSPSQEYWTEVPPTPIGTDSYLIIAPNGLNIRRTASINGVIVGKINAGSRVAVADKIVDSVNMIVWGRLADGRGYVALSQDGFIYASKQ